MVIEDLGTGSACSRWRSLQEFIAPDYTQANLILDRGSYPPDFAERVKPRLRALPAGRRIVSR